MPEALIDELVVDKDVLSISPSLTARIERLAKVVAPDQPAIVSYKAWMVPEGVPTIDGRMMLENSLDWRPIVPLMMIDRNLPMHLQAVLVGKVTDITREFSDSGETWITGTVTFDTDADAKEAQRMVDEGMMASVSVDVATHEVIMAKDPHTSEEPAKEETESEAVELPEGVEMAIKRGTIVGLTQVPMPAFGDARIDAVAAARLQPSWFMRPKLNGPTPIQWDEGFIVGHGAAWGTCHRGMHACVPPPKSNCQYAIAARAKSPLGAAVPIYFTSRGDPHAHAPLHLPFWEAIDWYEKHTQTVGLVATGEDPYGIWVAGACSRAAEGKNLSGDWRPYPDGYELVAWAIVNDPGYVVAESAVVASGPMAIVGAGIPCGCGSDGALMASETDPDQTMTELLDEIKALRALASGDLLAELRALRELGAQAMLSYRTHSVRSRLNGLG